MGLEVPEGAPEGGDQQQAQDVNPYDALVAGGQAKAAARAPLARSMYVADKIKPEDAQKALEMSKTSPLPASMILRNIQNGVRSDAPPGQTEYDRILDETPKVAQWASDPLNAAAGKNDFQKLQDLEKLFQAKDQKARPFLDSEIQQRAQAAAMTRAKAASQGSRYVPNLSSGELEDLGQDIPPEQFYPKFLDEELAKRRAENEFIKNPEKVGFSDAFSDPLKMLPIYGHIPDLMNDWDLKLAKDRIEAKQGTPADYDLTDRADRMEIAAQRRGKSALGYLGDFAATTPRFLGDLAFGGPAARAAGVGAKVAVSGLVGGLARKAVGFAANLGTQALISEGIPAIAGTIRRQTPVGEASVDDAGNFHYEIKSDKGEPMVLSFGKEALSSLLDIAGTKVPIGPFYKALSGEVGTTAAKGITARILHASVEGLKESLSGLTINEGTKLAKALTQVGPAYHLPSWQEVVGQGAGFAGMGFYHGMSQKADSTVRTAGGLHDLVDSVDAPPHVVESALEAITKGTPEEFLFVPVRDVNTFYQSKGLDPRAEIGKVLGDPAKYDQAVNSEYLQIPTSRYAVTIDRDPEASKFFQGKVKFDPMDASREELDAAIKGEKKPEQGPRQPAGQSTPEQQFQESGDQVARFIQGRMKELGFGREAEAYGKVWGERYKARAERRGLGELPGELFDKEQVGIFKREGPGAEAPEGEAQYVKVYEQSGQPHVERVAGATPAEAVQHAGELFPDATIEPMTPEEVKARLEDAMGGGPREFMQPGSVPRGSIEFGGEGADINLFRNANRSTFLHESGHKWFDELITDATAPGTSEQLRKDLDTVLKWMGSDATALQGGREVRRSLSEAHQEKWARGVEAYLMKGEAPSAELRGVFYRFANWLKGIYKTLAGLEQDAGQKLDISPEVRDVMDRLLASDQQIEEAKSSENVQSVLANATWLPAAAREEIGKALAGVGQAAREELNQKLMAQVREEESAQWNHERERMKGDIAREVDQRPEQIALANLERGTRPDGTPLGPEDLPAIKISRQATLDAYDGKKEALGGLPRRIFAKEGVTPDEAAEYFGFSSGDELLASLRKLYEPQTPEAREIKTKLEGLEMQRKLLLEAKQPLEAEAEEAVKNLKAGRKTLANKLERAIRDSERAAVEPINEILKDIRDRGGIDPTEPTEDLPAPLRSRKAGKGVSSDQIAQELYDRGQLDSADSDALYKKLAEWQQQVKDSRERQAGAPKEARRLAGERVASSIEALIENSKEQERLQTQLARLTSEEAAFKREHQVNQRKALIDRMADERMKSEHPDMLTDGSLPAEAQKSVYNAQRAKLMAREMELMVEHKFPAMKKAIDVLAKRGGFSDLMRAQAEEQLAKQKVREITPGMYKVASRVAGNQAVEAFKKGDWKGFIDAKRTELLNHELYRLAEKVRDGVASDRAYMAKFTSDAVRAKIGKAGGDFLDQIDDLMARFGFSQISRRESARRESLRTWYDQQVRLAADGEGYMPDIPPRVLDEAFKTNYKDMTYEEFQDVVDAAKNIEHLAGLKNRLLASADKRDFHERVDAGAESIKANSPGPRKQSLEPRLPGYELKKRGVAGFFASLRKMSSLVREMDGFKDGGVMWDLLIRPANRAGNREATMQAKGAEALGKLFDAYSPKEQLDMYRRRYIPEIQDSLSGWARIMVALNSGNEGNLQRLKDGYRWTDQQIQAIHDTLTAKDWALVKGIADHIETYWPEIRDLNKRVTGLEPEKVEPKPFMTKYGEMPGWYFPIKYEPILSPAAGEHEAVDQAKPSLMGATIMATTKSGHRQARMNHVERPLRLDPGVISEHLNQVIHDLSHFEFVVDTNRLLKNSKLQKAIIDHYGQQNFVQLKDWIKDIAVGLAPAKSQGERLLNWIRQGAVVSRLALNLNNVLTFQTGITLGMQRIGPEWVAKGWAQIGGDAMRMENAFEKIRGKSEFMANRWRTMLREVSEVTSSMTKKGKLELLADMGLDAVTGGHVDVEDIQHTFYTFLAKTYQMQDGPVWIGAYEKAMAEHPIESEHSAEDRDRIEKRAIDMADQAVLDSFGGGQIKDLSQTQRVGAAWKAFTAFGAWANTTLQRNVEAGTRWKNAPKTIGSTLKLGSDLALINILPAAAATAIGYALSNNRKDDKDFKKHLIADQAAQFMNQIPGMNQFTPALHGQDYEGPGGLELFQTGNRLLKSSIEAAEKKDIKKVDLKAANQTAGVLFHYPSVFVQRAAQALIESKHGAGEALKVFLGGRPRK